ncbi:hypothetical protein AALP_AA5G024300 [Arabis alpina]|uniref:Uncharacterized protein n=1 Tax=Arabis alpina TaxID=50452 RepID=A0A087GUH3_ARAAL|nr:hypothetical protein AALP_AA5G024300 [Arabis alpina]
MAISISGAVLSGMGSSFLISGGKKTGIGGGAMRVGRKNVIIAPQRKKSWVPAAVKGDAGNSKNDPKWLDDASERASKYVKDTGSEVGHVSAQKGQDLKDQMERARNYIVEKASEALDSVAENAHKASDFMVEKSKETTEEAISMTEKAKDFIVEKAGEAKDNATDLSKRTAKYVGDKAAEAKDAMLPPKN